MRYVIIGNSAAAVGAIEGIREHDQESPITVVADESQLPVDPLVTAPLKPCPSLRGPSMSQSTIKNTNSRSNRIGLSITSSTT